MIFFVNLFTFITFLLLFLDSFFYPQFSQSHFFVNSQIFLLVYIIFIFLYSLFHSLPILPSFVKFNQKFLFPLLSFASLGLMLAENLIYKNFVFTHAHLHPFIFPFLVIPSASIWYLSQKNLISSKIFSLLPPISLIIFFLFKFFNEKAFIFIVQEDGIVETIQFIFYLLAAVYTLRIYLMLKEKSANLATAWIFLLLTVGLFFIAGEEISWGQRLLGIETPESIKAINHQNEITLHNLEFFQRRLLHLSYMLVSLYSAFSGIFLKKIFPKFYSKIKIFTPPPFLFFCFFSTFAYYFSYDIYFAPKSIVWGHVPIVRWQEVFETYLSLGFLGYAYFTYQQLARKFTR